MLRQSDRQAASGITRDELKNMLEKYNIGKKPLSKLLGWGETTILLYLREDEEELPDNEYTRRLKNLYTHTSGYLALLNSAQGRISSVAKRRSIEAVRELFPTSPIFDASQYVVHYYEEKHPDYVDESLSLLRLETILFWSQIAALCLDGEPIFEDEYAPGRSGLPFKEVEERMTSSGCIVPKDLYDQTSLPASGLSDRQREILGFVTDMFDWYGPAALAELLEAERFRLCGPPSARRRRAASKDMLKKCYGEVFKQAKIKRLRDIEGYMMKRMSFIRQHKDD